MKDDFEKSLDDLLKTIEEDIEVDDEFIPKSIAHAGYIKPVTISRYSILMDMDLSYPGYLNRTDDAITSILDSPNNACGNQDNPCTLRNLCDECIPIFRPKIRHMVEYCRLHGANPEDLLVIHGITREYVIECSDE